MIEIVLTEGDREQIESLGISVEEIRRQLDLFRTPPPGARLVRCCRVDDGVRVLQEDELPLLLDTWNEAARAGRFTKFVPASGAASRMFQSLSAFLDGPLGSLEELAAAGSAEARDVALFRDQLLRFAFSVPGSVEASSDPSAVRALVRAVLGPEGLGFAEKPKGLIPFHRTPDGGRTPFEEHLIEGAMTVRDGDGRCRIHFTVSPEFDRDFRALLESRRAPLERSYGARLDVSFSVQHPSTDTIAVDLQNRPFRLDDGSLLFRPGGHGALLRNLAELRADLLYVKNIDNVVPESRLEVVVLWKKLLGGLLVSLERRALNLSRALEAPGCPGSVLDDAVRFLRSSFGVPVPATDSLEGLCRTLKRRLERPIRVCGVVRDQGEPGGGPFWVEGPDGEITAQIVESSQVDVSDPSQRKIWSSPTHFNPVDLVLSLRDQTGRPYDLDRFVDPSTVFISKRSRDGRDLKALELPGLWNGAMASWNTVFVEVPGETFAPVKTVLDLLRPEHQP
jgi:Domain of unknown function (DUF4301)